jgi:hypothetical protein
LALLGLALLGLCLTGTFRLRLPVPGLPILLSLFPSWAGLPVLRALRSLDLRRA